MIWLNISGGVSRAPKIKQKIIFIILYFIKKKMDRYFFTVAIYMNKGINKHKLKVKNNFMIKLIYSFILP
jgi:hypothetical protein